MKPGPILYPIAERPFKRTASAGLREIACGNSIDKDVATRRLVAIWSSQNSILPNGHCEDPIPASAHAPDHALTISSAACLDLALGDC